MIFAALAEDCIGVHGVDCVEIPEFDVGIEGADSNVVASGVGVCDAFAYWEV